MSRRAGAALKPPTTDTGTAVALVDFGCDLPGGGAVSEFEQQLIDGGVRESSSGRERLATGTEQADDAVAQRAARRTLKAQIAKLEHELSGIVADAFPFICPPRQAPAGPAFAPRLPDLAELERVRDRLAGRVQELRGLNAMRARQECQARELLERMKLEPGRYKFVRLPVSDLGQGGCGVWEVRPRLGLIGMLAGWWHVKLSSGCPLAT
jgi:hypothetical protein